MKGESSIFGAKPERLDRLVFEALQDSESEEEATPTASLGAVLERPGGRIGRYKLLGVLGEGGMGIVYLAEQEQPIKRMVALKVIKPGMDSKRVITRFEAERQVLALLDHPNIAHVYDAGTTESGRPYFVMEYVEGLPITEHCDHNKLTIEERLKLFVPVCHAVHHAHQKGIIHRDIKPSNILVSTTDDNVTPKIIDFGVAKAIAQPLTEQTLVTEQGQLFGTPEYMSPEQADMASEDIDTRSDIYSLGVLLYVLLTGVLPFDSDTLRTGGIEHIRKIIRETNPKTPSTRLTKLGEEAKKVAEKRRTQVVALAKCLHRELEWIPLKAIRKERSERYRSASELADDIENYLKGKPLIAGPPSSVYRVKKFVRRHKALVTGIATVLIVLVAGIIVSTLFALGQARARTEAERQARFSEAISDFLRNDLLGSINPDRTGSCEVTVSYILDVASENLESKFKDQPLVESSIRRTLGWTYRQLGKYDIAESNLERALQISREKLGEEHLNTLDCMSTLGWVYLDKGRYGEVERLWTRRYHCLQRLYGLDHPKMLHPMNALALIYHVLGRYDEAEELFVKAIAIDHCVPGEERWLTRIAMSNLASVYIDQGRYKEAEQICLRLQKIALVDEESLSGLAGAGLGRVYMHQGKYEEAEPLIVKALELQRRVLGEQHLYTLGSMNILARLYTEQGRYDEAESLFKQELEIGRNLVGEEHPDTSRYMNGLAVLYRRQKRYDEAERLFAEALKGRKLKLGEDHPDTLQTVNDYGVLRREQQLYKEAESLLRQALEGRQRKLGEDHPVYLESMHELAVLYIRQARYNEAEPLLLESAEGRIQKLGTQHPLTIESIDSLIQLYEAWEKPEQAEKWRAKLPNNKDTNK